MHAIGKSAQIAKEMQNYNLDILGISECRWTESGKLKLTKREWLNSLMDYAADMRNMKITKTIYNEGTHKNTAINDKGDKTITDDFSRLARWKEHFEEILNRHHSRTQ